MTDEQWTYIDAGGNQIGPVSIDALRQLYQQGALNAESQVWGPGLSNWAPAGQVPNLLAAPAPAPATAAPAAATASPQWFFMDGAGTRHGPLPVEQLRALHAAGTINHASMVWHEGAANWQPAGNIPNLLPPAQQQPVQGYQQPAAVAPAGAAMHATQSFGTQTAQFGGEADASVPAWMGSVNVGTILIALALFFLPWVQFRCSDPSAMMGAMLGGDKDSKSSEKSEKFAMAEQTGFETMTGEGGIADEYFDKMAEKMNLTDKQREDMEKQMEKQKKESSGEDDLGPAWYVIGAVACLGIGLVFALMALSSGARIHHLLAQGGCTAALALIGAQMLLGFPMQTEMEDQMDDSKGEAGSEMSEEQKEKMMEQMDEMIEIAYTPWIYVELGVLAIGLVLLLVTMSSRPKSANPYGFR